MKLSGIYINILLSIFVLAFHGCKKDEAIDSNNNFSKIKIYDDTTASGENPSVKISVGKERLYMTYGKGNAFGVFINGVVVLGANELEGTLMTTDLNGELLWRKSLPSGLYITTPIELKDGNSIVAGSNIGFYSININPENLYFLQFDKNGNQISYDSLNLVNFFGPGYNITNLDIVDAVNGNILVYGSILNYNTYSSEGFAFEYNPNGNTNFIKKINFITFADGSSQTQIERCTKTNDGGYIFLGVFPGNQVFGDPLLGKAIIIKTDKNCDTLWTRYYDYFDIQVPYNVSFTSNIIQLSNSGYRFCINEWYNGDIERYQSVIYEIDNDGDSLRAYTMEDSKTAYCPFIINDNNGTTMSLVNNYPSPLLPSWDGYFTQINSINYSFDNNLNLVKKSPFQIQRSDFLNSACTLPDGRVAVFGLFATNNYQSYKPGLLFLN